jgi:peptidoglycan hydrolase CwlO-like protein
LFKVRQEFNYYRESADSKIQELSEDKRNVNQKVRDLLADKEKASAEIQNAQMRVMETNHRYKQLEQERGLDKDNYDRALRETENMVAELREQLDLRTRELEYKDALLNQLIKQVSEPSSMLSQTMAQAVPQTMPRQQQPMPQRPLNQPLPSQQAMNDLPNEFKRDLFAQAKLGSTYTTSPEAPKSTAMRWGAIRK